MRVFLESIFFAGLHWCLFPLTKRSRPAYDFLMRLKIDFQGNDKVFCACRRRT